MDTMYNGTETGLQTVQISVEHIMKVTSFISNKTHVAAAYIPICVFPVHPLPSFCFTFKMGFETSSKRVVPNDRIICE